MADWLIEPLDKRTVCMKRRRSLPGSPQPLDTLPAEWREVLVRWANKHSGNSKWETLRKNVRVQLADDLLKWLLHAGWAAVVEERRPTDLNTWWPQRVELMHLPQLRAALGLRDKDADARHWQEIRAALQPLHDTALAPAVFALYDLPVHRALARHGLILALNEWRSAGRKGTHRDFAHAARDDTKGISAAEWNWLESALDLADFGIEPHIPLLLISAPLALQMPEGQIDLSIFPDFAALTPAAVQTATAASGALARWLLVENRTSFERAARNREADTGVIWLPGFPPGWWREAAGRLLDLAPAPAHIACDPDPSGIAIALKAAELWQSRTLEWQPWKMSAADLAALSARKPLSESDRQQLASLQAGSTLPPMLAELAAWMAGHGEKGEQEGYL